MRARITSQMPTIVEVATAITFSGSRSVQMLWAQPLLEMEGTGTGFRLTDTCAQRQRALVRCSYETATERGARFCIFPEYSLPLDMIRETDIFVAGPSWPNNSVWLSGLAPLSIVEFNELASEAGTLAPNAPLPAGAAEFVNCCCAWIKSSDGTVQRVLQPKLRPSRPEQATQGMHQGDTVYLFRTDVLSFCCLICFDCIGLEIDEFVASLTQNVTEGDSKNLHLVLVLEHNDHPENADFIAFAEKILLPQNPKLNTGLGAAVGFVNSAHKYHGRAIHEDFGRSSLCYIRRGNWAPCGDKGPLSSVPGTFAMENVGNTLLRVRFREDGSALHTFRYFIPSLLGPTAGETKFPIDSARMHRIGSNGLCQPGNVVPPLPKVLTDWLSSRITTDDGRFTAQSMVLRDAIRTSVAEIARLFETCNPDRIEQFITLLLGAFVPHSRPAAFNPDRWQTYPSNWVPDPHGQAFLELGSVSALLHLLATPDFVNCDHSHTCKLEQLLITVLDGNNNQNCHAIWAAYQEWLKAASWGETVGRRNVLVITRPAYMTNADVVTEVIPAYNVPTDSETLTLPPDIQAKRDSILETAPKFYWLSATALRGALDRAGIEDAKQQVRRALEPAIS